MATKVFHIEVTVSNVDTPERMNACIRAFKGLGQQAFAKMVLIVGENPGPDIMVYMEDFTNGRQEIDQIEDAGSSL
jgi:hypothetical protein